MKAANRLLSPGLAVGRYACALSCILLCLAASISFAAEPKLNDPQHKFTIALFASAPQIVNPIGVQVDAKGRVFAIESHTHFRPKNYVGPAKDRIVILEDTNGDSQADQVTVFHEGFTASMDLLLAANGDLYVAERSAIHLLRDKNGDGQADEETVVVKLETAGNYPHNGLSGLALDGHGGMYFGLGENLGAAYKLIGSDGNTLSGEAEGGSIYHMHLDGSKLRRVATGVWNPFGIGVDKSGNVFATDNDPDSSPPCRLLHVVEGGDYGYEFRYGRSGLHPFQCWNGELPGTLPMLSGIGEAPCEIVPWDNGLLIASWADNRLEHYTLKPHGQSFEVEQNVVISGDLNFRPVGIAVSSTEGALYVSDWASASYELLGTGRIWKLTPKQAARKEDARQPLNDNAEFQEFLKQPIAAKYLDHADPFFRHQAILAATKEIENDTFKGDVKELKPAGKAALVVAYKRAGKVAKLPEFLIDSDPAVRIAALKWVADQRLTEHRPAVEAGLKSSTLTRDLLAAYLATLERLDSPKVSGNLPKPELVLPILNDSKQSAAVRRLALMLLPPDHMELTAAKLNELLTLQDEALSLEVVRTMLLARHAERIKILAVLARDPAQPRALRAAAMAGLAGSGEYKSFLIKTATSDDRLLGLEALRSLVDMPLDAANREQLAKLGELPEVKRLLGKPAADLPPNSDIASWLALTAGAGDADAGRRIFFHSKVGYCARCHKYDGRGQQVGPDLTRIAERATPEWLLTAILNPSRDVAPVYRQWQIETKDGRQLVGLSLRKGSHAEDYLGLDGQPFTVRLDQIEERRESPLSMMPAGFEQQLTLGELRDLRAFLLQKK